MREGINIEVSAADRERLVAVVADRNSPQKHVWRARIILATAEGCGTAEIMRRAGVSKPCVWRWQERRASGRSGGELTLAWEECELRPPKALERHTTQRGFNSHSTFFIVLRCRRRPTGRKRSGEARLGRLAAAG